MAGQPSQVVRLEHRASHFSSIFRGLAASTLLVVLAVSTAHAIKGDCGQPVTNGVKPSAADALFALKTAVGIGNCEPCLCDVSGDGLVKAVDALRILRFAVGQPGSLTCPACVKCGNGKLDAGEDCDPPGAAGCNDACLFCTDGSETCNGIDDDCDDGVDEGFGQETCGVGLCEHTVELCVAGVPRTCEPLPPQSEVCDNDLDEDCDGKDCSALPIVLDVPALGVTDEADIDVTGTVDPRATKVTVGGVEAAVNGGVFRATLALREGPNMVVAAATDDEGNQGVDSYALTLDNTAPKIVISSPPDGFVTTEGSITVTGTVQDLVSGGLDAVVTVNGIDADLSLGAFVASAVPLLSGSNTLTATAVDAVGNERSHSVSIERKTPTGSRLALVSGDAQTGMVGEELAASFVVGIVDSMGNPLVGRSVVLRVVGGDGTLAGGEVEDARELTVVSGGDGRVSVRMTLGARAGAGGDRVEVSSPGTAGSLLLTATGLAKIPHRVLAVLGDNQTGVVGTPLPAPLEVLVVDEEGNPLGDASVLFQVLEGGGNFEGASQTVRTTDAEGVARVVWSLGPASGMSNNRAEAFFPEIATAHAVFRASAAAPGDAQQTSLAGVVLDNGDVPIPDVRVRVEGAEPGTFVERLTAEDGQFLLEGVTVGDANLYVLPASTSRPETFAGLVFETVTIAGRVNTLATGPIHLPELVSTGAVVGGGADVTLSMPGVPGLTLTVFAGSARFLSGAKVGKVSINQVHLDKIPMIPPGGSTFLGPAWTVQPPGVVFDPPARVTIPNDGLPPGSVVDIYQFDHDQYRFVSVGPGTVEETGATIVSNPGFGITHSGWGGGRRTQVRNTCAAQCDDGNPCTTDSCLAGACVNTVRSEGSICGDEANECGLPVCRGGACVEPTAAENCDDFDPCTRDGCFNDTCFHDPLAEGAECEDGEDCIDSTCQSGDCVPLLTFPNGKRCDDLNSCTLEDKCDLGVCVGQEQVFEIEAKVEGQDSAERSPDCEAQFSVSVKQTNCTGTVSYFWDFGDGFTGGGVAPKHAFAMGGSYSPTVLGTCGGCGILSTDSVAVTVGPTLEILQVSPFQKIDLGDDTTVRYRIAEPAAPFDTLRFEVRDRMDILVFRKTGLPVAAGTYDVVWPEAKWDSLAPNAFANPKNGPYRLELIGRKGSCDTKVSEMRDTHFVISANIEDKPAPGSDPTRVSGLKDLLDSLDVVLFDGTERLVVSGSPAITMSGPRDMKTIVVETDELDQLPDGMYEVRFRNLRDLVGNFSDADGAADNGIQPLKFEVELR